MKPIESPWVASFGSRLAAFLIDVLPITVLAAVVAYQNPAVAKAFDDFFRDSDAPGVREEFLKKRNGVRNYAAVAYLFYAAVFGATGLRGTVGKWCMGIKVEDKDNRRLSMARSMQREGLKMLSILPAFVGCLAALWDPRRRAWHDRLAATLVVKRKL